MNSPPKRLLDQVRDKIRIKHYSIRTEQAYVAWIRKHRGSGFHSLHIHLHPEHPVDPV